MHCQFKHHVGVGARCTAFCSVSRPYNKCLYNMFVPIILSILSPPKSMVSKSWIITSLTLSYYKLHKYDIYAGLVCWIIVLCPHFLCKYCTSSWCLRLICEFPVLIIWNIIPAMKVTKLHNIQKREIVYVVKRLLFSVITACHIFSVILCIDLKIRSLSSFPE